MCRWNAGVVSRGRKTETLRAVSTAQAVAGGPHGLWRRSVFEELAPELEPLFAAESVKSSGNGTGPHCVGRRNGLE